MTIDMPDCTETLMALVQQSSQLLVIRLKELLEVDFLVDQKIQYQI